MSENKIQKKTFPYEFDIELETRGRGNVLARCVQIPGCQAQGATPKEALEKLKTVMDLHFSAASPSFFESLESFPGIPTFYDLAEFKGRLFAATGRDQVLVSGSGAPGSWKKVQVTKADSRFFANPSNEKDSEGDYTTQIYCLAAFAAPGRESALYAGTNLNGAVYRSPDGEKWEETFLTGEDRIHSLIEFKNRLYAGTSSQGRVYAFDGDQWNNVASLSEVAVTCMGTFKGRLFAGTYPTGLIFSSPDGLNWEETVSSGQNFVQCFREFNGAFYAGTSSAKGVRIYRTENGKDWLSVYESARELNCYCMEVFDNALYAGTGNSGRVLKSRDGVVWKTAWAGDEEGIRAFAFFGDYLYACTENNGSILRSAFDVARIPELRELKVEKLTSSSALVTWSTDLSSSSEVHYGEKTKASELKKVVLDKTQVMKHRVHLTDLRAETAYEFQVVSAHGSASMSVNGSSSFTTPAVLPPSVSSPSHPDPDKWEKRENIEVLMHPTVPVAGYHYLLDLTPDTIPSPPASMYTEESRVAFLAMPQGAWYFHAVGVDDAGNIGTKATHFRVRLDTQAPPPPRVFSSTHPDPEKWMADPTPVIAWDKPDDLSGVQGYFVKADADPVTVPGPGNGDLTLENRQTLGPLEDGLWYVHIATLDEAGNAGRDAAHFPVRIDTKALAPTLTSPSHPQVDEWYSNNGVEVIVTPPYDLSGIEGYYYCVDQEAQTLPDPRTSSFTGEAKILLEDLKDGVWYVHARTLDRADNLSPQAAHFKVCIDTLASPPRVSSASHSEIDRWYRDRRVNLRWEDPFEHSGIEGYYYNIDRRSDTVPNDSTSLFTKDRSASFELTDDGLWYFHITTKDKAGNVDWKAVHYPLRVDTEVGKPVITSATHPENSPWSSKPRAVFTLIPPEDLSGVTGYYYTFTDDPKAVPDPKTAAFTDRSELILDIPRDGVHILSVLAQDAAGNISKEPTVYKVRLDTAVTPPEISSTSHPDPNRWYAGRRLELAWKDPSDLSGIDGFFYAINRNEHAAPELPSMTWTTGKGTVFTIPDDGVWFAHVTAKDKAGNIGEGGHFRIQVDSQAVAPFVKSPTHVQNQWSKTPVAKFVWDRPNELSGVEGFYVSLDSQPHTIPGPGNGKWIVENSITAPALKDGKWFFHAVTKDRVGNLSPEAAHYAFLIDTQPPQSKLKPLPPILDHTQIALEWEASDAHSGVSSYDVQVKTANGAWTDWLSKAPGREGIYPGQDGLRYAFRCRARDAAGNVENYPEAEMAWTAVDISPPSAVNSLKLTPKPGGDIELRWDPVEDRVSGTAYYRVYRWLEGEDKRKISVDGETTGNVFLDPGTGLKDGAVYYYSVQAVDQMGNEQHEGNQTAASMSDHTAGTPNVTSPSHASTDWSSNPTALLTWDAPPDATGIAGYYHSVDQSPSTKPDPSQAEFTDQRRAELTGLESGIWYFHLAAKDRAGNISDVPAHYRLKIDREKPEPPQVVSTSHPDSSRWYSTTKAIFKFASAPKLSGVEVFYCVFDRNPDTVPVPNEAQRVVEPEWAHKLSEPGAWWLHVSARDKAGNLSEPTHFRVLASLGELPPPAISSPTHPREDEATGLREPLFTWEDRHDGFYKIGGYVHKLSRSPVETLTADDTFTTETSVQLKELGEGTWYFHVGSVGKRGKLGVLSSVRKVVIEPLGKIQGTFLRKDGTTPAVGMKVEMVRGEKAIATAMTDEAGKFTLPNLPKGRYEIRLHSDQFPVLRVKDIPISSEEGPFHSIFVEDMGILPSPPVPGPIRFYYFLKEDCNVSLEIFGATGALVEKIEEKKEGGAYNVTIWDAAGRTVGEYLYKLSAKSITKNTMSRFAVKKFKLQKNFKELAAPTQA